MADSRIASPITDDGSTYHGWGEEYTDDDGHIIDHNFFSKDGIECVSYEICDDKWGENNENYLSDHNAIISVVRLAY